jgi:hypothetical protein
MTASQEALLVRTHNNGEGSASPQQQSPRQDQAPPAREASLGARKSEVVIVGLQKAMDELVKAQDHLNSASDQARDDIAKAIIGIIQRVRELQREVSNLIHIAGCSK